MLRMRLFPPNKIPIFHPSRTENILAYLRRLILRTLAAFGFWHYFSSLQTIMLVWLWVNWRSAITPLIFRLFWHSEKESVPLLHPKWYDRVQIVCIVHARWKSKREPVGALCDKKEKARKSSIHASTRVWATWSRARFIYFYFIYFTWHDWTFRAQAHLTFIFNPLQDCYG